MEQEEIEQKVEQVIEEAYPGYRPGDVGYERLEDEVLLGVYHGHYHDCGPDSLTPVQKERVANREYRNGFLTPVVAGGIAAAVALGGMWIGKTGLWMGEMEHLSTWAEWGLYIGSGLVAVTGAYNTWNCFRTYGKIRRELEQDKR